MSLLKLHACEMVFGGLVALDNVSFEVNPQTILGIIGPNGAGKTTLFNIITGLYKPTSGQVVFDGKDITTLLPYQISQLGIARTFQNIRLFSHLSVADTLRVALVQTLKTGLFSVLFQTEKMREEEQRIEVEIDKLLELFDFKKLKDHLAVSLPYGQQRRLEMLRALATKPKLLLLDEPGAGMNATEKKALRRLIETVKNQFNVAIILIEHDMDVVMPLCEQIVVLDYGAKIAEGTPKEIQAHPKVLEAYLGVPG